MAAPPPIRYTAPAFLNIFKEYFDDGFHRETGAYIYHPSI